MMMVMMQINIVDLGAFWDKYGVKGGVLLFFAILIYGISKSGAFSKILNTITERYIDYFMKKRSRSKLSNITMSDIENHDIFNHIDLWMYSRIPTFQFSTEYRTIVFRKYLTLYLREHKEYLQKFVSSKSYVDMDDAELWKKFLTLTNDVVHEYEITMRDSGIPQIVIEKMKSKNNDTISLTIDLIESICNSQFYKSESNLLKVYSILNIMLSILENTIQNSHQVCNSINGQLKGLVFNDSGSGKTYKEP